MSNCPLVAVVDDDESIRRSVKNLLGSVGIGVEMFRSAEAFLASPCLPSAGCLVLDLRLEGMTGLELMARLTASGRQISVVFVTAHGDETVRQQALKAGAVAFLLKPFRADALVDAVRDTLGVP
jgi:FixJ family two-component response regulator